MIILFTKSKQLLAKNRFADSAFPALPCITILAISGGYEKPAQHHHIRHHEDLTFEFGQKCLLLFVEQRRLQQGDA